MAEERERIRRWQEETDRAAAGLPALDPAAESEDEDVPYDSDDDEKTRAAKEARTRKAREREFAAKILTPDALVAAEGEDAGVAPASRVPEEALDRMLLEDDEDDAERETSKNVAKRPMKKPPAMRPIERRELPPPRATTRVAVAFTKLETDHMPARAHREKEIREWKKAHGKKNARDPLDEDAAVNITEREPVFLKDKGDAFFRAGNYRSALEAYTAAVDAERDAPRPDGTLVRLYANRAACCSRARTRGGGDCAAALASSSPTGGRGPGGVDPGRARAQRLRLITRRARAYVAVDRIDDARRDLEAATRLAPHDATLRRDLRDVSACATLDAAAARGVRRAIPRGGHRRRRAATPPSSTCHRTRAPETARRRSRTAPRVVSRDRITAPRATSRRRRTRRVAERRGRRRRARQSRRATATSQTPLPDASRALLGELLHRRGAAAAHARVRRRRRGLRRGGGVRDDGTRRRRAPTRRGNRPSAREEVGGGERDDVSVIPAFGRGARREDGIVGWTLGFA